MSTEHKKWMHEALELARLGLNTTRPNPRVGCVLVREGKLVGRGWHRRAGEPHAEYYALQEAGKLAAGATAYVTLEPCNHRGHTPPCCEALIAAKLNTVVVAHRDPDPRVCGRGIECLREAGMEVVEGVMQAEANALNAGFFKRMTRSLPWVIAKIAMSLDGRIAMASGESRWITGSRARTEGKALRSRVCALVTGIGTVLADDPELAAPAADSAPRDGHKLLRVIVDSRGQLPTDARLLSAEGDTLLAVADPDPQTDARLAGRAELVTLPDQKGSAVDLTALMHWLAEKKQCNEVLLEAGGKLTGTMLESGLIDELHLFVAPKLLGKDAQPAFALSLEKLSEHAGLRLVELSQCGEDIKIVAHPLKS